MDYGQEIVGGLGAGRGKGGNVCAAVAGGDYGDYIALGIPERAVAIIVGLPILRINILGGGDGILRTCLLYHISEPTRQAEISYAVFCLKKKKKKKQKNR